MINLFFSYSHKDKNMRDELEIHLAALKRQGVIARWHDRRINAGQWVDHEISEHLESADIILLLVSPYFIASDYCYDVEMKRAIERHKQGDAHVIPVIIHPCDWQGLLFGKLMATPTDGKPISKFPNIHDGFLEVTKAVRKVTEEMQKEAPPADAMEPEAHRGVPLGTGMITRRRSSNLRIKKTFTDREKDQFLADAFEYMANFFEESLIELKNRNPEVDTDFRRVDANHFTATVYIDGAEANRFRIWLGGRGSFANGIAYSAGHSIGDNNYNESLSVEDDGYTLFLKPLGMAFHMDKRGDQMTHAGGAEYFWEIFIDPLQR